MKTGYVVCDQTRYAEFPELKSGTLDGSSDYLDMTQYIADKELGETHSVTKFQQKFFFLLVSAQKSYSIPPDAMIIRNDIDGHDLLAIELALLFIMYTDPLFVSYILDRTDELLTQGISISDTALQQLHHSRFPMTGSAAS